MDTPTQVAATRDEAEHRFIGGPDAIAAFDLLPPEAKEQIREEPEGAFAGMWATWLTATTWMHSMGLPQRALCDAVTTVTEARTATVDDRQTAA